LKNLFVEEPYFKETIVTQIEQLSIVN